MPWACFAPHRRNNSSTMSLPLTHDWSWPVNPTRRAFATVK